MAAHKNPHVHPVDERWLALGAEEEFAPKIDIVDSHIHLWDFSNPPYFADSYTRDAQAAHISASIYVDCTMAYREDGPKELEPIGEVEFARKQGEGATGPVNVAAAIVGWVDLTLGDAVDDVLVELAKAGGGRCRGVRTRATYDPDPSVGYGADGIGPGLMLRDDYRRGVARLEAQGMVLDLYAFHTQMAEVASLAGAFPNLPIILNHIGGPLGVGHYAEERDRVFADWSAGMTEVGACRNVSVKIGGFAISRIGIVKAAGKKTPSTSIEVAETCKPWVDHCLKAFGVERCMFGSNFPVDKVAMPLRTLVNAMKRLTEHLTASERNLFFATNARNIYRI